MLNRLQGVFKSLEEKNVSYLVIGGIAAVLHGVPRAPFDLDILIDATHDNAKRLLEALDQAGLGTASLITAEEMLKNEITVFEDWVRIDAQTRTPGIQFEQAWKQHEVMEYREQRFYVVSREDLIKAKKASGSDVDMDDVRLLEQNEGG